MAGGWQVGEEEEEEEEEGGKGQQAQILQEVKDGASASREGKIDTHTQQATHTHNRQTQNTHSIQHNRRAHTQKTQTQSTQHTEDTLQTRARATHID